MADMYWGLDDIAWSKRHLIVLSVNDFPKPRADRRTRQYFEELVRAWVWDSKTDKDKKIASMWVGYDDSLYVNIEERRMQHFETEDDPVRSGDFVRTATLSRPFKFLWSSVGVISPFLFLSWFRSFGGPNVLTGGGFKTPTTNFLD